MKHFIKFFFLLFSFIISVEASAGSLDLTSTATNNGNNTFTVSNCGNLTFSSKFTYSTFGWSQNLFRLTRNVSSQLGTESHNHFGVGNVTIIKTFTVPSAEGVYRVKRKGLTTSANSNDITINYAPNLTCGSSNTTTSFGANMWFAQSNSQSTPVVGDFDNDNYEDDIAYFGKCDTGYKSWRVHLSDGTAFSTDCFGGDMWFHSSDVRSTPMVGDFDGDGFNDDIAYYGKCGSGVGVACWRAHLSNGSSFSVTSLGASMWFAEADARSKPFVGDFDNDGFKDDISYYGKCGNNSATCWRMHITN